MTQGNPDEARPHVRFPPPLVFIGFMLLGLAADRLFALPPLSVPPALGWAGLVLAIAGLVLIAVAIGLFRKAGENPEPWTPSETMIASGPYRLTRNPMYLGMAAVQLGFGLWWPSIGVLVLLPVAVILIDRTVIAKEESYLRATFGEAYDGYCRQVRRWI
ncbi:isoprenylcysteine carboxylmethyltransferase family protein [Parasphingopyxis algicola]|uniref:methyltransferase family protein n=1 Tax=Parasphingopyxis algicola TaxID=2026624 RepID=UPI0015A1E854|nr:isoprenylcysteine carboxylmethyltransferase family protein [Parasphingopyxis algicola]QLC24492.1 isoprenylcysteine carboxylmethyltransferase family protein [Parasphingopyxis algicola]